jgi:hypothetical protein
LKPKSKVTFGLVVAKQEAVYPESGRAPHILFSWKYREKGTGATKTWKYKAYIPEADRRDPEADHADLIQLFRSKAEVAWGKKAATLL